MLRPFTRSAWKISFLLAVAISTAQAAVITYTNDEAGFSAALGGAPVTVESFETTIPLASNPAVYPTTTVSCSGVNCGAFGQSSFITSDGLLSVLFYGQDFLTFTWSSPITAFAIDVLDLGTVGQTTFSATINGQTVDLFTDFTGGFANVQFIGLIDTAGFTSVTLSGTAGGDAIYLDRLQTAVADTPEPTTAWLVFGGLSLLAAGRKLRALRS